MRFFGEGDNEIRKQEQGRATAFSMRTKYLRSNKIKFSLFKKKQKYKEEQPEMSTLDQVKKAHEDLSKTA